MSEAAGSRDGAPLTPPPGRAGPGWTGAAEPLVLRLGLVAAGLISWRTTQSLSAAALPGQAGAATVLQLLAWLWGFLLLACSALRSPPRRVAWLIPVSFLLAAAVHARIDAADKVLFGGTITTDAHIYLDHAARLLREGVNPYGQSMLEAYRVNRAPLTYSTPLVSGDLTDRLPYPALSFLLLLPFQWLGIPTYLAFFLFFCATLVLLYRHAPPVLRPLVLLPFFANSVFLNYSLGGVTDTVWAFLLVMCVLTWNRGPWRRALWYGLACSFKQHPWALAPFLVIRIWSETPGSGAQRRRAVAAFLAGAGAVFLLINAPFALWDPASWARGILEPLSAPMVALGDGLTALGITGTAAIRRADFAWMQWSVLGLLLWVYGRHVAALRPLAWVAPALAMWFSHRSLPSYWYFNVLPLLTDLMRPSPPLPAGRPAGGAPASLRTTLAVSGMLAALMAGWIWQEQRNPPGLEIATVGPAHAPRGRFVSSLRLTVRNGSRRPIRPAFTVKPPRNQAHRWRVLQGPGQLQPGEVADYSIAAPSTISIYDLAHGARLSVHEDGAYEPRATTWVPGVPDSRYPDAFPNEGFTVWTRGAPTFWRLLRRGDPGARAVPLRTADGTAVKVRPGSGKGRRLIGIATRLMLPEHPVTFSAFLPGDANLEGRMEMIYGVHLRVRGRSHLILFGDRGHTGSLGGVPYLMLRAPRDAWSTHRVDLKSVLSSLGADLSRSRSELDRFEHLDLPAAYLDVELFLCAPPGAGIPPVRFGPVTNTRLGADPDLITDTSARREAETLAWRGGFTMDAGSDLLAMKYFTRALALDPRGEFSFGLAEAASRAGRDEEALRAYRAAIDAGWEVGRSQAGRGWILSRSGNGPQAREAFREAVRELEPDDAVAADRPGDGAAGCFTADPLPDRREHLADALRGLALAAAEAGDCDEARTASDRIAALGVGTRGPDSAAVARCLEQGQGRTRKRRRR